MAGSRTGTPTVIKLARRICHLVNTWHVSDLQAKTSSDFKDAVMLLVAACAVLEAADNFPFQIDRVAPDGPEDPGMSP